MVAVGLPGIAWDGARHTMPHFGHALGQALKSYAGHCVFVILILSTKKVPGTFSFLFAHIL